MFKKLIIITLFLFLPHTVLGSDNRLLDGFDQWKEKKGLQAVEEKKMTPLSFDDWKEARDKQVPVQPSDKQVPLSPQAQAQNQILDDFIKMFITGIFFVLLAGFSGLTSWAYTKVTGKKAEVEMDEKSNTEVASRVKRMANFSIDCLILINGISALIAYSVISFEWYGLFEYWWFIWIGIVLFYYIFFEGFFGWTPGKLVTRTKVIGKSGAKPDFGEVVGRSLLRFMPFEIFSYMGKSALGWHDRWSGTMVISTALDTGIVELRKEGKYFHFLSNAILISSVFIIATFLLSASYDIDPDDGGFFLAIPITILVLFVYGKVSKKLNL